MSEADPQVRRRSQDYHGFIDAEAGTIDRRIFSDEEIYRKELEQIFARAWNFMCHESQIPKPGDFFLSFIGEESVIATRDRTGTLQVFLNTCRHRGNAVCRAETGHASAFMCTYHGWTYDLEGKLKGVPGFRDFYSGELDKSQWGLIKAGKVQSYKGFVFATMDPQAPDLHDYLGEVGRMGMDQIAARGQLVVVDGIQKNTIRCNWKMSVDNNFDWYHANVSHASVMRHNSNKVDGPPPPGISEEVRDALGLVVGVAHEPVELHLARLSRHVRSVITFPRPHIVPKVDYPRRPCVIPCSPRSSSRPSRAAAIPIRPPRPPRPRKSRLS